MTSNFPTPSQNPNDVFSRVVMGGYSTEDVDLYYAEANRRIAEMEKSLRESESRVKQAEAERDQAAARYETQLRSMDSNSAVSEARRIFLSDARKEAAHIVSTAEGEAASIISKAKEFADGERARMEALSKKNQDDFEARLERETNEHIERLAKLDEIREEDNENRRRKERESLDTIAAHKAASLDEIEAAARKSEESLRAERERMDAEFRERERKFEARMNEERQQFEEYKERSLAELRGYSAQFHAKTVQALRSIAGQEKSLRELSDLGSTLTTIVSNKDYAAGAPESHEDVPQKAAQPNPAPKSQKESPKH